MRVNLRKALRKARPMVAPANFITCPPTQAVTTRQPQAVSDKKSQRHTDGTQLAQEEKTRSEMRGKLGRGP